MDNPLLLLLRLEGPMQSWGLKARWDIRDTGDEPTKSGIIGLLGCALGYARKDPRLTDELDSQLRIGIRVECPGEIARDYHTVSGELRTAEGKLRETTIVSFRDYLQDAAFLVVLEGPGELLTRISNALKDPVWPIYLGRKSCPPTRPVFETLTTDYASIDDALSRHPWSSGTMEARKAHPKELKCIVEDLSGPYQRTDRMTKSPARMYGIRHVRMSTVKLQAEGEGL
ncbi:type I-E CRISPR-associated protein Cas5/CasD [Methanocella arvoryzae]|uniref:Type I-E CRISPR-associated protein Cas5/CasD n=1 Tax=Methanocella arvoryzae (strain DSM 22066 / NBRC 105507 / MRE50) TaxID=351160 RepID=Q0W584_METAR|nr:type I-E CRISPR-associated protein Cas5/CasD [Methanocella arvoryzae]CAJ36459.1 conserved hypothetical protein [Methanocella arvoryzae MRE50]